MIIFIIYLFFAEFMGLTPCPLKVYTGGEIDWTEYEDHNLHPYQNIRQELDKVLLHDE